MVESMVGSKVASKEQHLAEMKVDLMAASSDIHSAAWKAQSMVASKVSLKADMLVASSVDLLVASKDIHLVEPMADQSADWTVA